mgnify:CR=1 FL=1
MAMSRSTRDPGHAWMVLLLVFLVGLNDPLYIARVVLGGNQLMYSISVLAQIIFSGILFLFWLVYADSMAEAESGTPKHSASLVSVCTIHFPKLALVSFYVGVSATMFLLHGRVPDRINVTEADGLADPAQRRLVYSLTASVVAVGVWLSVLITRDVRNLRWTKGG